MKNIILVTSSFPYGGEEQFLEAEMHYYKDVQLTIIPLHGNKENRTIDSSIKVDNFFIENSDNRKIKTIIRIMQSFFFIVFYKELLTNNMLNRDKIRTFFRSITKYITFRKNFDIYFRNRGDMKNSVVYTYWNDEATYALQSLKEKYGYKLVSRIHRFDIYKEWQLSNYMPLKSQFVTDIDKIYTLTSSATNYLHDTYGFDMKLLELSRLGVEDYGIKTLANEVHTLHVTSCSYLISVKKVDKIIDALVIISKKTPHVNYIWTHIGSGELYDMLVQLAHDKLDKLVNVEFEFKGYFQNRAIYDFYKNNKIDLFMNVSESEGVPVSIMEAMSCRIPIVAPDVGGISDMLISNVNGVLLSSEAKVIEIAQALEKIEMFKSDKIRDNSYEIYQDKYSAKKNYTLFLAKIKKL